jgi:hypothetical protein
MSREQDIHWLQGQAPLNIDIRMLEDAAARDDVFHDTAPLLWAAVINSEDDSYELVEDSHFPLRACFGKAGMTVVAPNIHADMLGQPHLVRSTRAWDELNDGEVAGLVGLVDQLQRQYQPLPKIHIDETIAAQAALTSYRVCFYRPEIGELCTRVIWDLNEAGLEQHLREQFGSRLRSLEHLGPMEFNA